MRKIIIIGGGISGLSCGVYLRHQGFDVTIIERNPNVGGFCTGWVRQGRYIDGCIHWLTGSKEGKTCNHIWKSVGAFKDDKELIQLDTWGNFYYGDTVVPFLRDYKKSEEIWLNIAPEDKRQIKKFFKMVRASMSVTLPMDKAPYDLSFKQYMQVAFSVLKHPSYLYTMKMNTDKYALRFKNPAIRYAVKNAQPGPGNLFSMIYSYATVASGDGGVPQGASVALANNMLEKYLSLGGKVITSEEVKDVLIDNKTVKGIVLNNDERMSCDFLVAALDPYYTLHNLLHDKYKEKGMYKRLKDPYKYPPISAVLVTYEIEGLKEDFDTICTFPVEPFKVQGKEVDSIEIRNYSYDKKLFVKDNKTVCNTQIHQFHDEYLKWVELYKDKKAYKAYKDEMAQEVIKRIETKFPEYKGKIHLLDVCTPITFNRYLNAKDGAYMSLFTPKKPRLSHKGKIKGLKNMLLCTNWQQTPGGLPFAVSQGKYTTQHVCKAYKIKFKEIIKP